MKYVNKKIKKLFELVQKEKVQMKKLSDEELQMKSEEFKKRIAKGESLNSLLPEAFALVCEADRRILGMDPYDVQILGGIALHLCYLAEMNTGEGKTLTATMPLYLNALTGKGAILVTSNEYLAIRDAQEMGPVYRFLGLSVCAGVKKDQNDAIEDKDEKKEIYAKDIVYTTHSALGFDYLIQNLAKTEEQRFLRPFNYVIIDEADQVLLDSSSMPLVISGSPRVQSNLYAMCDFFVTTLRKDEHYKLEEHKVWLTQKGIDYAQSFFRIDNFYAHKHFEINRHVTLAMRAHFLMEKEEDYVLTDQNEVILLDKSSGRKMKGVKLKGGLHQAIEEKEHVNVSQETRSVASITFQNLFLLFPRMSGMSGTIQDGKDELMRVYGKKVVSIPPHKKVQRIDYPDLYFKTSEEQFQAVLDETIKRHQKRQPVLLITTLISDTELLSKLLIEHQIEHSVLNANNAFWEAEIIKEAGQKNAVTVATSMAGRGTDIHLGKGVKELGGLCVIGVGRMDNSRLERQARGRAGRQGDPGMSQFYTSLEDDVVNLSDHSYKKYIEEDQRISTFRIRSIINKSQRVKEEQAVFSRKNSCDFDAVLQRQRTIIYKTRNDLLEGNNLNEELILGIIQETIHNFSKEKKQITSSEINRYILDHLSYQIEVGIQKEDLLPYAKKQYFKKKEEVGIDFKFYCRSCILEAIDEAWIEEVDYLQQMQAAIAGRSLAQRNLLFEFQKEARSSYKEMEKMIKENIVRNIMLSLVHYDSKSHEMQIIYP